MKSRLHVIVRHLSRSLAFSAVLLAGVFAATAADLAADTGQQKTLVNRQTSQPIKQIVLAGDGAACSASEQLRVTLAGGRLRAQSCAKGSCASVSPTKLTFKDDHGVVVAGKLQVKGNAPPSAGGIEPVLGPDDLLYLCKEDEEAKQCVCIPFVH